MSENKYVVFISGNCIFIIDSSHKSFKCYRNTVTRICKRFTRRFVIKAFHDEHHSYFDAGILYGWDSSNLDNQCKVLQDKYNCYSNSIIRYYV